MPNLLSNYIGGSKPKLITRLTSGTGNYVPTADMARCLIVMVGGGGGGASYGGGAGSYVEFARRIPIAGLAYTVGANGTGAAAAGTATSGSSTKFDTIVAPGGQGGYGTGSNFGGGKGGIATTNVNGTTSVVAAGTIATVHGGCGGTASTDHGAAGFPWAAQTTSGSLSSNIATNHITGTATASGGQACGGDSFLGRGGASQAGGTGAAGSGYGSGGAGGSTAGGNGAGGCIEIWDFGA